MADIYTDATDDFLQAQAAEAQVAGTLEKLRQLQDKTLKEEERRRLQRSDRKLQSTPPQIQTRPQTVGEIMSEVKRHAPKSSEDLKRDFGHSQTMLPAGIDYSEGAAPYDVFSAVVSNDNSKLKAKSFSTFQGKREDNSPSMSATLPPGTSYSVDFTFPRVGAPVTMYETDSVDAQFKGMSRQPGSQTTLTPPMISPGIGLPVQFGFDDPVYKSTPQNAPATDQMLVQYQYATMPVETTVDGIPYTSMPVNTSVFPATTPVLTQYTSLPTETILKTDYPSTSPVLYTSIPTTANTIVSEKVPPDQPPIIKHPKQFSSMPAGKLRTADVSLSQNLTLPPGGARYGGYGSLSQELRSEPILSDAPPPEFGSAVRLDQGPSLTPPRGRSRPWQSEKLYRPERSLSPVGEFRSERLLSPYRSEVIDRTREWMPRAERSTSLPRFAPSRSEFVPTMSDRDLQPRLVHPREIQRSYSGERYYGSGYYSPRGSLQVASYRPTSGYYGGSRIAEVPPDWNLALTKNEPEFRESSGLWDQMLEDPLVDEDPDLTEARMARERELIDRSYVPVSSWRGRYGQSYEYPMQRDYFGSRGRLPGQRVIPADIQFRWRQGPRGEFAAYPSTPVDLKGMDRMHPLMKADKLYALQDVTRLRQVQQEEAYNEWVRTRTRRDDNECPIS